MCHLLTNATVVPLGGACWSYRYQPSVGLSVGIKSISATTNHPAKQTSGSGVNQDNSKAVNVSPWVLSHGHLKPGVPCVRLTKLSFKLSLSTVSVPSVPSVLWCSLLAPSLVVPLSAETFTCAQATVASGAEKPPPMRLTQRCSALPLRCCCLAYSVSAANLSS